VPTRAAIDQSPLRATAKPGGQKAPSPSWASLSFTRGRGGGGRGLQLAVELFVQPQREDDRTRGQGLSRRALFLHSRRSQRPTRRQRSKHLHRVTLSSQIPECPHTSGSRPRPAASNCEARQDSFVGFAQLYAALFWQLAERAVELLCVCVFVITSLCKGISIVPFRGGGAWPGGASCRVDFTEGGRANKQEKWPKRIGSTTFY
jgi:hypothetical protein